MKSVFNLLRKACGLSQQETSDYLDVQLGTIKSICSGRCPAAPGTIAELQLLIRDIQAAGEDLAALLKQTSKSGIYVIGMPLDAKDSRVCGFPSLSAQLRAIGIAISLLPDDGDIRLVERACGAIPSAVLQRGKSKIRTIPETILASVPPDLPDPAPGGLLNQVNVRPRTPDEITRSRLSASKGARFEATLQATLSGSQASFRIFLDVSGATNSTSDIQLFDSEPSALNWLDRNAAAFGFTKYPLERRK